jgi:hypothetical protein
VAYLGITDIDGLIQRLYLIKTHSPADDTPPATPESEED